MGRPKVQFCLRGHNTFIAGRVNGCCIICKQEYREAKRDSINEYAKQYYQENKGIIIKQNSEYYEMDKENIQEKQRTYRKEHAEEIKNQRKEYREKNKERIAKDKLIYTINKLESDPIFKLKFLLRGRIRIAIKKNYKAGSAVRDLGCSVEFFKQYIENKFYGNMTWSNWGEVWELDHIKELHTFDLTDRNQLLEACHYTNLQPLTIEDHRKKTAKGRNT